MNTAQIVSRFAATSIESCEKHGPIMGMDGLTMAHKFAREQGGKARTKGGQVRGYRFADGSAVTANFVEFLGTWPSER